MILSLEVVMRRALGALGMEERTHEMLRRRRRRRRGAREKAEIRKGHALEMRNEAPDFVSSTACSCQLEKETAAARLQLVHVDVYVSETLLQEDDKGCSFFLLRRRRRGRRLTVSELPAIQETLAQTHTAAVNTIVSKG